MSNKPFSVTFWIRSQENKLWNDKDSSIDFPHAVVLGGVMICTVKRATNLYFYIMHPQIGTLRADVDASEYIGSDLFVAVTYSEAGEAKLYLNGKLSEQSPYRAIQNNLEIDDFALGEVRAGDSTEIKVEGNASAVFPGQIKSIKDDRVSLYLFNPKIVISLPMSQVF